MFDENDDDEKSDGVPGGSLGALRDHALYLFAQFASHAAKKPLLFSLEHQRQFLSVDETEAIVREYSTALPGAPEGVYAVGGDSKEEFDKKMRALFAALLERIQSNVTEYGVKNGYLDCAFDDNENNFVFTPTQKGQAILDKCRAAHAKRNTSVEPSNN